MIYYIYKVRRKQTSIHFSRSALPHRYLRSISWISWNGGHRPQPSTSWVSTCAPPCAASCAPACDEVPHQAAALPLLPPGGQANALRSFLKKKKTALFPFFAYLYVSFLLRCSTRKLFARRLRPSTACSCGPPINKKCGPAALRREPAHHVCQTCSKKCRLLAQESTRRHAWLTRSCFGRVVFQQRRPAFTTALFPFSFFTRKRKKKTEANSAGSNTSLGLTSFVLTMYAIGPSRLVR